MTTYVVYSDTNDGYVRSSDTSYATAREGGGGLSVFTFGNLSAGQALSGGTYYVHQPMLSFDTSAVPAGTDSGILISLNVTTARSKVFEIWEHAWTPPISTAAFVAGSSLASKTLFGTHTPSATGRRSWSSSLTSIPRSSGYRVLVAAEEQRTNVAPTGDSMFIFNPADTSGTTSDPYLQFDSAGGSTTITITAASLSLTGQSVTIAGDRTVSIGTAALTLAPQALTILRQRTITITAAALTLTGQAVSILMDRIISIGTAAIATAGKNVIVDAGQVVALIKRGLGRLGRIGL